MPIQGPCWRPLSQRPHGVIHHLHNKFHRSSAHPALGNGHFADQRGGQTSHQRAQKAVGKIASGMHPARLPGESKTERTTQFRLRDPAPRGLTRARNAGTRVGNRKHKAIQPANSASQLALFALTIRPPSRNHAHSSPIG